MAKRGEELRNHIRWTAKDVFLELGFERTSMDIVANRAQTSKRSLYSHFESKEKLYLAVVELVRGLFLDHLGNPEHHIHSAVDPLVAFCARYIETLLYEKSIQMFRLNAAETTRFPNGAATYHSVVFTEVETRITDYLAQRYSCSPEIAVYQANRLLGRILYPALPRALFGIDPPLATLGEALSPKFDMSPVLEAVAELRRDLNQHSPADTRSRQL